jgi:N-acetylglucosaminyldiphosphoundecaprenol N-acetyl-beta-D-mannosaminyltransferase
MPKELTRFPVLGLAVDILSDYSQWLVDRLVQGQGVHVVTLNAEMAMLAETDQTLAHIINQADLVIPDGAGIVFYLHLQHQQVRRCPGIELAERLLHQSVLQSPPWSVLFYGGAPGVAEAAAQTWLQRIPGLQMAGTQHGYLNPEQMEALLGQLQIHQPQIIFVGLGVPRQEYWISQHRHLCPHAVWVGVGGSFDIWSGNKDRAPQWLRSIHLEWIYRLYQEPSRWQRMLALPKFAWRTMIATLTSI